MTADATLTTDERALLIEGYRQNIVDVVAACEWILSARLDALHAENTELRQLLKEANSAYVARSAERDALRDAMTTAKAEGWAEGYTTGSRDGTDVLTPNPYRLSEAGERRE